jgi:hypothetical protein
MKAAIVAVCYMTAGTYFSVLTALPWLIVNLAPQKKIYANKTIDVNPILGAYNALSCLFGYENFIQTPGLCGRRWPLELYMNFN